MSLFHKKNKSLEKESSSILFKNVAGEDTPATKISKFLNIKKKYFYIFNGTYKGIHMNFYLNHCYEGTNPIPLQAILNRISSCSALIEAIRVDQPTKSSTEDIEIKINLYEFIKKCSCKNIEDTDNVPQCLYYVYLDDYDIHMYITFSDEPRTYELQSLIFNS